MMPGASASRPRSCRPTRGAPAAWRCTIARLKEAWLDEHEHWRKRDLSAKRYVYVWADGIYLQARLEDTKQCILVIIGATPEGKKELLGFTDGGRENAPDLWGHPARFR